VSDARQWVKRQPALKNLALLAMRITSPVLGAARPSALLRYPKFFRELTRFRAMGGVARIADFWPCLFDRTIKSSIDTHYFYQAVWAFKHILATAVPVHIDIGSQVNFVGLLTTITRVIFIDIRPLAIAISNYSGLGASIVSLPLRDGSVSSLSSLHVIEHIGLGRYGDPIDPNGSIKAAREIVRVLAPGGRAYISVPIGRPRVQFNGQRVYSVADILSLFHGLNIVEMAMVDASGIFHDDVKPESVHISEIGYGSDFGLGIFCFQRKA